MEDNTIIDMYWQKNQEAISCTDIKYGKYLETISYNIVHDYKDTLECKNDTLLKVWNSIPPERPNVLRIYLGTIIRNISLSLYRYKHTKKRIPTEFVTLLSELDDTVPTMSNVENAIKQGEVVKLINEFLKSQSEEKCAMFIKRYWHCVSIEAISKQFGCSKSKVKSALFYTRTKLKEYLESAGVVI